MAKILAVLVSVAMLAAAAFPVMAKEGGAPKVKEVKVDRNKDGKIDGVDIYDEEGRVTRRGYDTDNNGTFDRWQSYDPNTNMPTVVDSDRYGQLR